MPKSPKKPRPSSDPNVAAFRVVESLTADKTKHQTRKPRRRPKKVRERQP